MKTRYDYHLVEFVKSASTCVYVCLIRLKTNIINRPFVLPCPAISPFSLVEIRINKWLTFVMTNVIWHLRSNDSYLLMYWMVRKLKRCRYVISDFETIQRNNPNFTKNRFVKAVTLLFFVDSVSLIINNICICFLQTFLFPCFFHSRIDSPTRIDQSSFQIQH